MPLLYRRTIFILIGSAREKVTTAKNSFLNGCVHEKAKCQFYSTFVMHMNGKKYIFSCLYNSHILNGTDRKNNF
jgi:hypothetical protein